MAAWVLAAAAAEGAQGQAGRAVLFVVNSYTGTIGEYDAATGATINASFITDLNGPEDLAVSGSTLYVTLTGDARVATYDTNTGALLNGSFIVGSFGSYPIGITASGGDIFTTVQTAGAVSEYNASTGATVAAPLAVTSGYYPEGVAIVNGEAYVTNEDQGTVDAFSVATGQGTWSFINEGLGVGPYGILAVGSNLLIANNRTNVVAEYTQGGARVNASFISSLSAPFALATDGGSTLYVTNYANGLPGTGSIGAYNINSGATVNAALVPGLAGPQGLAYAVIAVDHFAITVPSQSGQQVPFFFTVTAEDANNHPVTTYSGPVHFTSSDPYALLPPDETLAQGTGTFSAALTSLGDETITVADASVPTVAATSANIDNVQPPDWPYLLVTAPATAIYGAPVQIQVAGIGANDETNFSDNDGLSFATTDPLAVFPGTGGLANGYEAFNCTFYTIGTQQFYAYDTTAGGISGSSFNIVVGAASTSVAVQTSPSSPIAGQSTTLTATVTTQLPSVAGVNAGQIVFNENGVSLGTAAVGSNGQAVLVTSALTAGTANIQAVYTQGSPRFNSGVGTTQVTIQNSGAAATTTVLASNPSGPVFGQPLTLTATVTASGAPVTTGTVAFMDNFNNVTLGSIAVNGSGQASLPANGLAAGLHGVTATYSPASGAYAGSSGFLDVTVGNAATTVALGALPSPASPAQAVTLTATVSVNAPSAATVTAGSVAFSVNGTVVGTEPIGTLGRATYVAPSLPLGNNALSAAYIPPNGSGLSGSSGSAQDDVVAAVTGTVLSASTVSAVDGQPVTLTATVTSGGAPVTSGSVVFADGGVSLGSGTLDGAGQALLTVNNLALGARSLSATFTPSSDALAGSAGGTTVTVVDASTDVSVSADPASPTPGESVTLTAQVAAAAPSDLAISSGSVTFSVNGTTVGSAPVTAGGQASLTVNSLGAGTSNVVATYTPANNSGLASSMGSDNVTETTTIATATALSLSTQAAVAGQPVTLTASVTASSAVTTGTVTFAENGAPLGSAAVDANGQASFTVSALTVGTDSLTAAYDPGASNFGASEGGASATIGDAATAVALQSDPSVATPGAPVTLTATVTAAAPSLEQVGGGSVAFSANGSELGTAAVNAQGSASFTTSQLPAGSVALTASFTPAGGSGLLASSGSLTLSDVAAPAITLQPASASVPAGGEAFFWVTATGTPPVTYQWYFNGSAIAGANQALLAVANAQTEDAGSYSVSISNDAGSVSSSAATLTVTAAGGAPPHLLVEPLSQTITPHTTLVLTALLGSGTISGASLRHGATADVSGGTAYQWFLNGAPIPGATSSTLVITNATSADAGSYTCVITTASGAVQTAPATIAIAAAPNPGHLVNASCLAEVGGASNPLIMGVESGPPGGAATEPVLVRASGPALQAFGVAGWLPDPQLVLYGSGGVVASNSGWSGNSQVLAAAQMVGAFPWASPESHDAAVLESLAAGGYSAVIDSASGQSGLVLGEFYDATAGGASGAPQLLDASARAVVGAGNQALTLGFVVGGTTSATVLLRASGPALAAFGVSGTLSDPELKLYGGGTMALMQTNAGWAGDPNVASVAATVGAFSWGSAATPDAALLVTLPPGAYTAQVSGASGDTGAALVEVYLVP